MNVVTVVNVVYFDGSHIGNRAELEGKWANFGKRISRAITYVKMKENSDLTPRPPCYASVFGISLCTFGSCDLVFDFVFFGIFLFM